MITPKYSKMRPTRQKRSKGEKIVLTIISVLFALYTVTLIYPFLVAIFNSLKTPGEYLDNKVGVPNLWLFSNYFKAFETLNFKGYNFFGMFFNSILLTFLAVVFNTVSCLLSSYAIAKYKNKFGSFLYSLAVILMVVPVIGNTGAMLNLTKSLGLQNSIVGVSLLYSGGFGISFLILHGAFKSVSWEYAEAGLIDGASHFKIFYKIMIPQVTGVIFAVAMLQTVSIWNDYFTSYLYMPLVPTIAVGLYYLEPILRQQGSNMPIYFAAVIMATIPMIIVFVAFQKVFITNMSVGGLKG